MKKVVICLVAVLLYTSIPTTDLLNPLYPVYAEEGETMTAKPTKPPVEKRMDDSKIRMEARENEMKKGLDDKKEKIASRVGEIKDKMASKEAMLKAKLALFKDKTKALRVEKINTTLQTIDTNRTSMMKKHLEVLTKILETIETRVNEAQSSGKNVDGAKTAISDARSAIQTATTAVTAQSEKDYTIEATSEATVKTDAKKTRDGLMTDLKSTHELVKKAQEAVRTALKAAKEAVGISPTPEAS
jgi:rubrerythrin